jgi:hypothetical protein
MGSENAHRRTENAGIGFDFDFFFTAVPQIMAMNFTFVGTDDEAWGLFVTVKAREPSEQAVDVRAYTNQAENV